MKTIGIGSGWLLFALVALFGTACQPKVDSKEAFLQWIDNPDHGLTKQKDINGFQVSVKYLPPSYLAYREWEGKGFGKSGFDSLLHDYTHSRTFLLTIAPDREHPERSVMFHDVLNRAEYKERVRDLNFNIGEYLQLKTEKGVFLPVLHHMENTYELADHRSIYLVFSDKDLENPRLTTARELDLVYNDRLFGTGLSHFYFRKEDIDRRPDIAFAKLN